MTEIRIKEEIEKIKTVCELTRYFHGGLDVDDYAELLEEALEQIEQIQSENEQLKNKNRALVLSTCRLSAENQRLKEKIAILEEAKEQ